MDRVVRQESRIESRGTNRRSSSAAGVGSDRSCHLSSAESCGSARLDPTRLVSLNWTHPGLGQEYGEEGPLLFCGFCRVTVSA
jgi:hypothetical protein